MRTSGKLLKNLTKLCWLPESEKQMKIPNMQSEFYNLYFCIYFQRL